MTMASAPAQQVQPLGGHLADDANGQARAGEGVAPHDLVGQAQLLSHRPHLVLEKVAQGFDQLEPHVVGKPPTLWWLLIIAASPPPDSITSG